MLATFKIMDELTELNLRQKLQNLAWQKAGETLIESGFSEHDKFYSLRKYEMQFSIYQQLKLCYGLK